MDFSDALKEVKVGNRIVRCKHLDVHTRTYTKAYPPAVLAQQLAAGEKPEDVTEEINLKSWVYLKNGAQLTRHIQTARRLDR